MRFVLVGVAGAAGALTRYAIGLAVGPRTFPWATLGINVSGSFVLAFVLAYATSRHVSPEVTAAAAVGFLGAYTTFSTFAYEAFTMEHTHRVLVGGAYVALSVTLGLLAAAGGYNLARAAARA